MVLFSGSAVIVFLVGVQFSLADPSPCLHDHLHISDELQVIEHLGQESPIDVPEDAINGIIFVPDDSHYSGFAAETFQQMKPIRQIDVELPAGANLTAWPAPVITSVSKQKTTGGNLARFLMKWEISPRANLTGFRAMVCTPKCTSTSTTSTERKVIVKVPFVTKFNISVVALYKSPNASEPIESPSNISLYDSGVGLPSPVKRIKGKLENRDRSLKLTWDRPSSPNGPIDFYSVHVNDIINGAKAFWKQPATTEVVLNVTGTSGYGFEAILKAVNIDPDSKEEFTSEETRYSLTHVKLGKPAKVTAVSRWQSSITLQMSPPNSRKPFPFQVLFEIKGGGRAKKDYVTDLIIFDRLYPYQYVSVDVSACYLTATFREYICGNSIRWSGRSNVAAPSPIPKVDIIQSANNDTQLKWTLPEKPNGPIDGFIVNRRETGDPPREWKNIRSLDSSARTVTIGREELLEGISYEFGVAAFNRDLQQTSQVYYSNLTIATLPARPTASKTWIIPTVVFAVLVVLAGMGIGIYFHVRSGKPLPRVITFSKA